MSDEPITCRYIFTGKEYGNATRSYWRHSKAVWIAPLVILGVIFFNIFSDLYLSPSQAMTLQTAISNVLPPLIVLALIFLIAYFAGGFMFRKGAFFNKEMIYTLGEGGVHVHSPLTETEMKWPIYASATESPQGFALFLQGKRSFNWLPMQGFTGPGEIDRCRELIRVQVKDAKRLRS